MTCDDRVSGTHSVHPGIASAVLGHATPAFTLTQYSHVLDGMTDVAADVIDAAFASNS